MQKLLSKRLAATWLVRACFGLVFAWNMVCALQFIITPANYVGTFGLEGKVGQVAVAGLGVAFVMWNCTFPAFIVRPQRFMSLGIVAIVQQIVGIVGETWILFTLAAGLAPDGAIVQFLFFDVSGLILMLGSLVFLWKVRRFSTKSEA
jgi:hypothetical protein